MTAEGEHLAGSFARTSNSQARKIVNTAWRKFNLLAEERGWNPKPIPQDQFELTLGDPVQHGGLKLEVSSRDLPRGSDRRPGKAEWERESYNLNWIDLSPQESEQLVRESPQRTRVPNELLEKISMTTIRDNVRGQYGWKKGAFREGEMYTKLVHRDASQRTNQLTGFAILKEGSRAIAVQIHGQVVFDSDRGDFTSFDMVVAGQRQGAAGANGRQNDLGPAPIGIAYSLYKPVKGKR